jgi:hypothetical protein
MTAVSAATVVRIVSPSAAAGLWSSAIAAGRSPVRLGPRAECLLGKGNAPP